jgi:hypothetical protein
VQYVVSHVDQWLTHPDATLVDDVAVLAWAPPAELVDYLVYPVESSVSETTGHGVGDEVFLPGLFVNHVGRERNIPIVRTGNIAAMPDEPIDSKIGSLDAYLVEARSIGGLSGSPVFVNLGLYRRVGGTLMQAQDGQSVFRLLGLMHGHYQLKAPVTNAAELDGLSDEAINMGIAIVVPADRIKDVVNRREYAEARDRADREAADSLQPVLDSAQTLEMPDDEANESEFERFEDLTDKLLRVPKKELDEKLRDS